MLKVDSADNYTPPNKPFTPLPKYGILGLSEDTHMHGYKKGLLGYELLPMEWVAFWFRKENLHLLETQGISALPKPTDWVLAMYYIDDEDRWDLKVMKRGDAEAEMSSVASDGSFDLDAEHLLLGHPYPTPPRTQKRPHADDESDGREHHLDKKPKSVPLL